MKKTKINLLISQENYQKVEKYFQYLRYAVFILFIIFFVLVSLFLIMRISQNNQINQLQVQKRALLEIVKSKSSDEAKISYIQKKYQSVKEFLKDDAYSLPYYNLLNSAISSSTQPAALKSFQIAKSREVTFTISYNDLGDLLNFLKFVESEKFLKNFEKLSFKSFTAIGDINVSKANYDLSFVGKFIPIKSGLE